MIIKKILLKISAIPLFFIFSSYAHVNIIPLQNIQKLYPNVYCKKCFDEVFFKYKPFSIIPDMKYSGYFLKTFILTLPGATVQSPHGIVLLDNYFIKELIWADQPEMLDNISQVEDISKLPGRIAVLNSIAIASYSHWFDEVLGQLALLEMHDVAYDWLYVPFFKSFMIETLQLWGIDLSKVVICVDNNSAIRADAVIVASSLINTNLGFKNHIGCYPHPYTARYVSNKLLHAVSKKDIDTKNFSKKIFISRKDAPLRRIVNEDEVYEQLKLYGFERYELSKLSVTEQILLFNQAEVVVATHGTGLVNTMFCKPKTKVIEIFQELIDSSFWYMANIFDLQYIPISTVNIKSDHFLFWPNYYDEYVQAWQTSTSISPQTVDQIINYL